MLFCSQGSRAHFADFNAMTRRRKDPSWKLRNENCELQIAPSASGGPALRRADLTPGRTRCIATPLQHAGNAESAGSYWACDVLCLIRQPVRPLGSIDYPASANRQV